MRTVLITGANKGIGFETAKQLAELGYHVFLGSRDKPKGVEAINQLTEAGMANVELIEIDVTNLDSIKKAKQELEGKIECLHVLINNAGISSVGKPQMASSTAVETIHDLFETNYFGAVQTTQQFLSLLKKLDKPRIVNVSSELGSLTLQSDPNWAYYAFKPTAYIATKAALNSYTIALAYELKDSPFKINSVNPGATATDLNNHRGERSPAVSAKIIVKYATIDNDGPSGKFLTEEGELPW